VDRIPVSHVGSLVRPAELAAFLAAKEHGGEVDEVAFEKCLRRSVADVVRAQAEAGVDVVSDGEFGKSVSWSRYVRERIEGFEERPLPPGSEGIVPETVDRRRFREFYDEYDRTQGFVGSIAPWVCTGPVRYVGQDAVGRDIRNLHDAVAAVGGVTAFLPVVAPASLVPTYADEHYGNERDYVFAVADALGEEYRAIADAGLVVQVDDAWLPMMWDILQASGEAGRFRAWAELRIEALARALAGVRPEQVRYHVCWGSWNGPHVGDVPLREIVDLILRVPAGTYSLEQANPRHEHEWRVWEEVELPPGKRLMPGVIGHATNVVEHPELVAERLVRLAGLVGRENVVAGTDCGFAQGPLVRRVHPTIQWAKLRALAEGAQLASRRLWS
jgi:5-methyltetrahydropteroyltriglutamate--homocysteine methyltransferase